jgi:hypothetical protein
MGSGLRRNDTVDFARLQEGSDAANSRLNSDMKAYLAIEASW